MSLHFVSGNLRVALLLGALFSFSGCLGSHFEPASKPYIQGKRELFHGFGYKPVFDEIKLSGSDGFLITGRIGPGQTIRTTEVYEVIGHDVDNMKIDDSQPVVVTRTLKTYEDTLVETPTGIHIFLGRAGVKPDPVGTIQTVLLPPTTAPWDEDRKSFCELKTDAEGRFQIVVPLPPGYSLLPLPPIRGLVVNSDVPEVRQAVVDLGFDMAAHTVGYAPHLEFPRVWYYRADPKQVDDFVLKRTTRLVVQPVAADSGKRLRADLGEVKVEALDGADLEGTWQSFAKELQADGMDPKAIEEFIRAGKWRFPYLITTSAYRGNAYFWPIRPILILGRHYRVRVDRAERNYGPADVEVSPTSPGEMKLEVKLPPRQDSTSYYPTIDYTSFSCHFHW